MVERLLQMRLSCPFNWRPTRPGRSYPVGGSHAPNFPIATLELVQRSHLEVVLRSNRSLPKNSIIFFGVPVFFFFALCIPLQAESFKFGISSR